MNSGHDEMARDAQEPGGQVTQGDRENARLISQFAHHDIWWYRSNLWNATYWALLLIAAVVGMARLFLSETALGYRNTWHLAGLEFVIGLASCLYLAHLHAEIVETRRLNRNAARLAGLEQLRERLAGRSYARTDHSRGAVLILTMDVALAVGSGAAIAYLTHLQWLGWVGGALTFVVGSAYLAYVVCSRGSAADA